MYRLHIHLISSENQGVLRYHDAMHWEFPQNLLCALVSSMLLGISNLHMEQFHLPTDYIMLKHYVTIFNVLLTLDSPQVILPEEFFVPRFQSRTEFRLYKSVFHEILSDLN